MKEVKATPKCRNCKKQSTIRVDQEAPPDREGQTSTTWQCPHCATTNVYKHK